MASNPKITSPLTLNRGIPANPADPAIPNLQAAPLVQPHLEIIEKIANEEFEKNKVEQLLPPSTPRTLADRTVPLSPATPEQSVSDASADSTPKKGLVTPPRKSKLFESDTDSAPTTPVKAAPKGAAVPETPSPLKDAKDIIRTNDPQYNLLRADKKRLKEGMDCLATLTSPQHSAQVKAVSGLIKDALAKNSPVVEVRSPLAPKKLMLVMDEGADEMDQSWIAETLEPTGTTVLDRMHHTKFIKGSGKHICPIGDPLDKRILKRRVNLETGVWCGMITTPNQEEKFSSFIPRPMTEEQYFSLLHKTLENKNLCIARGDNKGLFEMHSKDYHFFIEVYTLAQGAVIKSAFPIFHYEYYTGRQKTLKIEISLKWSIDENDPVIYTSYEVPYQVILDHVKALKKGAEAIQYKTTTSYIVDVNLLVGSNPNYTSPIPRGVLVNIPKKFLV